MSTSLSKVELKNMIMEIMGGAREYSRHGVKPYESAQDITDAAASIIIDSIPEFPEEDLPAALEQLREFLLPAVESMIQHAESDF